MSGSCSARDLRGALSSALRALEARASELDALNVFPVADADTGANLVATFRAVVRASETVSTDPDIARSIRSGSLMGARGNSGVIAAQILRAWADAVEGGPADAEMIARAFKRSVELAYEAVLEPADGTILSVLRAASEAAQSDEDDVGVRFARAAEAAIEALGQTTALNPVLARAGVVDAGGAGFAIALAAIAESLGAQRIFLQSLPAPRAWLCDDPPTFGFEVMYLLRAGDDAIAPLRELLGTIGDSVAIVGGMGEWRVHVHTDDHERAIALGEAVGDAADVQVVSFAEQMTGVRGVGLARAATSAALVVVADGEGWHRMFSDLGATVVTSAERLPGAIGSARADHVIVLPNDAQVREQAVRAGAEIDKAVTVLPSSDLVQGLIAAVAYGDARTADQNIADMRAALERVRTAGADEDPAGVAGRLVTTATEVLTIVCGAGVSEAEATSLADDLAGAHRHVAVEVHLGGQGHPRFLLAAE